MASHAAPEPLATTGIAGLDEVLGGGFVPGTAYLIEGTPGTGKTTLALQFALEGLRLGQSVLYVTLSESHEETVATGRAHGWDLQALHVVSTAAPEEVLHTEGKYTMFHPAEVELIKPVIGTRALWRRPETRLVNGQRQGAYNENGEVFCHCPKSGPAQRMAFGGRTRPQRRSRQGHYRPKAPAPVEKPAFSRVPARTLAIGRLSRLANAFCPVSLVRTDHEMPTAQMPHFRA